MYLGWFTFRLFGVGVGVKKRSFDVFSIGIGFIGGKNELFEFILSLGGDILKII
jgi:hypothetical protein